MKIFKIILMSSLIFTTIYSKQVEKPKIDNKSNIIDQLKKLKSYDYVNYDKIECKPDNIYNKVCTINNLLFKYIKYIPYWDSQGNETTKPIFITIRIERIMLYNPDIFDVQYPGIVVLNKNISKKIVKNKIVIENIYRNDEPLLKFLIYNNYLNPIIKNYISPNKYDLKIVSRNTYISDKEKGLRISSNNQAFIGNGSLQIDSIIDILPNGLDILNNEMFRRLHYEEYMFQFLSNVIVRKLTFKINHKNRDFIEKGIKEFNTKNPKYAVSFNEEKLKKFLKDYLSNSGIDDKTIEQIVKKAKDLYFGKTSNITVILTGKGYDANVASLSAAFITTMATKKPTSILNLFNMSIK